MIKVFILYLHMAAPRQWSLDKMHDANLQITLHDESYRSTYDNKKHIIRLMPWIKFMRLVRKIYWNDEAHDDIIELLGYYRPWNPGMPRRKV